MDIITGYKATDKDIKCRGFQFEVGVWHEADGELEVCKNGFHFCEQPSGPWAYYSDPGTRVWKIEAKGVLDAKQEPGASAKRVARYIRLVEEVVADGDCNTGDRNTGDCNTGDRNTGDYNTGHRNTGHRNTGNYNTGDRNTGDCNTGNCNTGNCNTGNYNTGRRNTGDCNTGHRNTGNYNTGRGNTGHYNTGHRNTGDCNTTNYSAGWFCQNEPTVLCFDVDTGLTREEFTSTYRSQLRDLESALLGDKPIDMSPSLAQLPGITPEKLTSLHAKFIQARTVSQETSQKGH